MILLLLITISVLALFNPRIEEIEGGFILFYSFNGRKEKLFRW